MADLKRCAENNFAQCVRSFLYVRVLIYTHTPARTINGHAEIRPSLAPRLARMLEQESVSAILGSQP